jgi:glutamate dehydrogenase (NAD(P)+)
MSAARPPSPSPKWAPKSSPFPTTPPPTTTPPASTSARPSPTSSLELPCTVLVPAAVERVITAANAPKLRCRILAEAANGPTTNEADVILDQRDDLEIIPDVLCNSGGVIVSYFEWLQNLQNFYWSRDEVIAKLHVILDRAKSSVEYQKRKLKFSRRLAALTLGIQRVATAKHQRGLFP